MESGSRRFVKQLAQRLNAFIELVSLIEFSSGIKSDREVTIILVHCACRGVAVGVGVGV